MGDHVSGLPLAFGILIPVEGHRLSGHMDGVWVSHIQQVSYSHIFISFLPQLWCSWKKVSGSST